MQDKQNNKHIIAGKHAVHDFLQDRPGQIDSVLFQENRRKDVHALIELCLSAGVKYQLVPKKKLDQMTRLKHQGVVARIFPSGFQDIDELLKSLHRFQLPLMLGLDQVQDAGNIGTLCRTLYALGGAGLILPKARTAHLGSRAYKSAAGALSKISVSRVTNLARFLRRCQELNINSYYAGTDTSCTSLFEENIRWPAILILGNEEKGVRPGVAKECTKGLYIPMLGSFDSINVAQAGAIFIGEFLRKKLMK